MATGTEHRHDGGGVRAPGRAAIAAAHLRTGRWWPAPAGTAAGPPAFAAYSARAS
ncbi:hypothetical protein ACL07V_11445 [Streptomyces sp. MB22_4]|uniref:hypothetical protein n=1 Tax=Streptomyces sp. MB22_4 TaxID=3383120 RepID=UPI0039A2C040